VDANTLAPQPLPDLFAGAPVVISGRYAGQPDRSATITVIGREGWATKVTASSGRQASLGAVWARARIRDLEDRYVIGGGGALEREIVDTSLRFGVLSRFTAFVAVDQRVVNEGGTVRRIAQPVESPRGWELPVAPAAVPLRGVMPAGGVFGFPCGGTRAGADRVEQAHGLSHGFTPEPIRAQVLPASIDEELRLLRESAGKDVWERAALLTALAGRLRDVARDHTGALADFLTKLAEKLEVPTSDPAEVERRWQRTLRMLESLTAPPVPPSTRRTFWKR
jgi:Ca-activated chloride channel family protein